MKPRILIAAGAGEGFGTGHRERMKILHKLLSGAAEHCTDYTEDLKQAENCGPETLLILDARDTDPGNYRGAGWVLALDNRHPESAGGNTEIWNTLPHFQDSPEDLPEIMDRMLIFPYYKTIKVSEIPENQSILVYTGSTAVAEEAEEQLRMLMETKDVRITRVGIRTEITDKLINNCRNYSFYERLDPDRFADLMAGSSVIVSYFGVTAFHAMYLGKQTVFLKGVSSLHDRLTHTFLDHYSDCVKKMHGFSESMQNLKVYSAAVSGLAEFLSRSAESGRNPEASGCSPSGRGFELLVRRSLLALERLSEKLSI